MIYKVQRIDTTNTKTQEDIINRYCRDNDAKLVAVSHPYFYFELKPIEFDFSNLELSARWYEGIDG